MVQAPASPLGAGRTRRRKLSFLDKNDHTRPPSPLSTSALPVRVGNLSLFMRIFPDPESSACLFPLLHCLTSGFSVPDQHSTLPIRVASLFTLGAWPFFQWLGKPFQILLFLSSVQIHVVAEGCLGAEGEVSSCSTDVLLGLRGQISTYLKAWPWLIWPSVILPFLWGKSEISHLKGDCVLLFSAWL